MKNIVITGAGSGIGLALVRTYLSRGYQVYATKLKNQEVPLKDASIVFIDVDFLEDRSNEWMDGLPGQIDIFIANAGVGSYEENTVPDTDDPLYVLNTLTPIRQFARLRQRGFKGTFVVMGSVMAFWPLPGYARYAHTKSALVTYFKALQSTEPTDIVILMPVAVRTHFFIRADQGHEPLFIQEPDRLARRMARVIGKNRKLWISSRLFAIAYKISPRILRSYLKRESRLYHRNFDPNR